MLIVQRILLWLLVLPIVLAQAAPQAATNGWTGMGQLE